MWKPLRCDEFASRYKKYAKNHKAAAEATIENLGRFIQLLNQGIHLSRITSGFIHPEPHGVKAIDQTGAPRKLRETRLYVYPDIETETIHVITIGDKKSQSRDIQKVCNPYVKQLKE